MEEYIITVDCRVKTNKPINEIEIALSDIIEDNSSDLSFEVDGISSEQVFDDDYFEEGDNEDE